MTTAQQDLLAVHLLTGIPQVGEIVICDNRWWGEVLTVDPDKEYCSVMLHGRIDSNYPIQYGKTITTLFKFVEGMKR